MRRLAALTVTLVCLAACEVPQRPEPRQPTLDKRALYGDASLLPTREGERVRRELALAGELEQALGMLGLNDVRIDIELGETPQVIVVARVLAGRDRPGLAETIDELGRAIVPGQPDMHIELIDIGSHATATAAPAGEPTAERTWALMIVCLGLGLSLGVLGERLRGRRQRPSPPQ